jgi:hypothetical protein
MWGNADGTLDAWFNGVQTHHETNMQYAMDRAATGVRKWLSLAINPTFGGGLNPVPHDQYVLLDHVKVSGSN